jgi:hypothetical protein
MLCCSQVTATWAAEADAKRLAALAACIEAEPIPVVNEVPEADAAADHQRGRSGAADADGMAVDGSSHKASSNSKKQHKKGWKAGTAAAGGVIKKKKQTAGVKLAKEFSKKQRKARRSRI